MTNAQSQDNRYTQTEEVVHAALHGFGAVASVGGLVVLLWLALERDSGAATLAAAVYGTSLVLCYLASTLYHGLPPGPAKRFFLLCDHCAIYLLIAGTYTPFTLLALDPPIGTALFAAVWALALAGIGLEIITRLLPRGRRIAWLSVPLYLGIGWLGLAVAGEEIVASLPPTGLELLVLGGVLYTGGVVFYLWRRFPFNHAVWHTLVLIASGAHFTAVATYVMPAAA
ncbi:PAQR family membrane homeostasis protein TrhA [Algihabitans albus]|uniref:PAQR family membrane homeostasis protein TrhA n=1 Tax=Algihabitans albus TaxID=2164067 RepID=UPI000E5D3540|nr:hemolysin III family protein [Algihabitans albus]